MPEAFKAKPDAGFDSAKRQTRHLADTAVGNIVEISRPQCLCLFGGKPAQGGDQMAGFLLQCKNLRRIGRITFDLGQVFRLGQRPPPRKVDPAIAGDAVDPACGIGAMRVELCCLVPDCQHYILHRILG